MKKNKLEIIAQIANTEPSNRTTADRDMLNSIRNDFGSTKNTPLTTFRTKMSGRDGTGQSTQMMTPLDSAKLKGAVQTVQVFLDLNDEEHLTENVPQEEADIENPNPSSRLKVKFVGKSNLMDR